MGFDILFHLGQLLIGMKNLRCIFYQNRASYFIYLYFTKLLVTSQIILDLAAVGRIAYQLLAIQTHPPREIRSYLHGTDKHIYFIFRDIHKIHDTHFFHALYNLMSKRDCSIKEQPPAWNYSALAAS